MFCVVFDHWALHVILAHYTALRLSATIFSGLIFGYVGWCQWHGQLDRRAYGYVPWVRSEYFNMICRDFDIRDCGITRLFFERILRTCQILVERQKRGNSSIVWLYWSEIFNSTLQTCLALPKLAKVGVLGWDRSRSIASHRVSWVHHGQMAIWIVWLVTGRHPNRQVPRTSAWWVGSALSRHRLLYPPS